MASGCAKAEGQGDRGSADVAGGDEAVQEYVYVPEFSEFDIRLDVAEDMGTGQPIAYFVKAGKAYIVINDWLKGQVYVSVMDVDTGEHSVNEMENSGTYYNTVNGFAVYDNSGNSSDNIVYLYDDNWQLTGSIDLGSILRDMGSNGQNFTCKNITVDNKGNVAVLGGRVVLLFDSGYNLVRNINVPDKIREANELFVTREGNWYVGCSLRVDSGFGTVQGICELDMENGEFGEELEVPYDVRMNSSQSISMYCIDEGGFYIHGKDYIYRYDEGTKLFEKLFSPSDYGITVDFQTVFNVDDNGILYIGNELSYDNAAVRYEVAGVEKKAASEVKERTPVVLGYMGIASSAYEPILQFNKYNKDYYIKLKGYLGTEVDFDTAKQNFYNDLLNGEGADIFYVYYGETGIDVANLGSKGILADLYEFIDNDEEVDRNDFVPNLLKQMEHEDGKLYAMYFKPTISYLAGKEAVFDGYEEWNYETLLGIMKEYPDSLLIANNVREWMFRRFMQYSMGTFYDMNTGECSFDSDEFKAMLRILSMIPEKMDYELQESLARLIDNDEVLIYDGSMNTDEKTYFGNNAVRYLGVPTSGGAAEVNFFFGLAINAQSENKQAAWEFIKYFFREDFQMGDIFPTMKEYVDAKIEENMLGTGGDKNKTSEE